MKRHFQRLPTSLAIILCFFLSTALPAKAETDSKQDGWKFGGAVYLWAAGVKGTSVTGDEIDVSFSDVLDDLDGTVHPFQHLAAHLVFIVVARRLEAEQPVVAGFLDQFQ